MAEQRDPRKPHLHADSRQNGMRQDNAPAFTVQDEIRRDRRVRRAGQYRRARRRTAPMVAVAVCVLLCLALLGGAAALLLRVETVTVDGNVRYTDGEILTASGIHAGDSMLLIRKDKLLRKITALCPHVETIEIAKTYPSALTIRVTETGAVYFTQVRDRVCTLDASLRVIECTDAVDGLIELRLPEIKSAVEGSALVFADAEDDARVRTILEARTTCLRLIVSTCVIAIISRRMRQGGRRSCSATPRDSRSSSVLQERFMPMPLPKARAGRVLTFRNRRGSVSAMIKL